MKLLVALAMSAAVTAPAPADFTVRVDPGTVNVAVGHSAGASVRTTAGPAGPERITLSAAGLPTGVTAAFTPSTLDTGQDAAITLKAAIDAPPGVYRARVIGTNASGATVAGEFTVSLRPDDPPVGFAVSTSSRALTVEAGAQVSTTVHSNGQGGQITLSASGLPAGAQAQFQPGAIAIGSTATLTFTTTSTATIGTSTVVVTGTDTTGRPARAELTLTVTPPTVRVVATPSSGTGQLVSTTVTATGGTGNLTLTASGVPTGTRVYWHPQTIAQGGAARVWFFSTFQTPVGAYPVTVKATSADGASGTTTFTLTVTRY